MRLNSAVIKSDGAWIGRGLCTRGALIADKTEKGMNGGFSDKNILRSLDNGASTRTAGPSTQRGTAYFKAGKNDGSRAVRTLLSHIVRILPIVYFYHYRNARVRRQLIFMAPRFYMGAGRGAVKPSCSKKAATRKTCCSCHGAPMICMPIGNPPGLLTGTTATGKPIKESGCV